MGAASWECLECDGCGGEGGAHVSDVVATRSLSFTLPDARITLTAEPHRCSRLFRLDRVALPSGGEAAISLGTSGLSPSGGPGFVPRVGVESSGSERCRGFGPVYSHSVRTVQKVKK